VLAALSASPARGDARVTATETTTEEPAPKKAAPSPGRRALALTAALVPGVLVHGSGHWVSGRAKTARLLLLYEGIGLGSAAVSLGGLALTGASQYTVTPFAIGALGGLGLFGVTLLADLYGVLAPEGGRGAPETELPLLEIHAGLVHVYDPLFSHEYFWSQGFSLEAGPLRLSPSIELGLDAPTYRYSLFVARRLVGPGVNQAARSGTSVDVTLGATDHAYHDDGFGLTAFELRFDSRLDLGDIDANLAGSFAESSLGYARELIRYDGAPADQTDELLARVGFGIYLGSPGGVHGETVIVYDHRRDTLAGGMHFAGVPAGYAGHLEQRTRLYFAPGFGAELQFDYGSAFVSALSLLFRPGARP